MEYIIVEFLDIEGTKLTTGSSSQTNNNSSSSGTTQFRIPRTTNARELQSLINKLLKNVIFFLFI